jgi:hypothetical protein
MEPVNVGPILLVGAGFFLGTLFSILILDYIYKGIMKNAIEEIWQQYNAALEKIKDENSKKSG